VGDFTKRVRDGEIAGPLRRAFTQEKWERAFDASPAPDAIDSNTHVAGLAVHEKLQAIRSVLKLSSSEKLSATTKLRAFLAIANHDFFVTRDRAERAMKDFQAEREAEPGKSYIMEEMAGVKLELSSGFAFRPDELVESIVDGIELPIRTVLQIKPSLAGNPRMNHVQWKEAARELNFGILYRFAEDIWDDCLWNEYKIVEEDQIKEFLPQDMDPIRAYQIGLARRNSLWTGFAVLAAQLQHEALALGSRLKIREVCGIERQGKRQIVKLSKHGDSSEILRDLLILRAYATEPYYGELLDEPLGSLGGLNLSALIDAWTVLSRIAHMLVQSVDEKHARNLKGDGAHAQFPDYVPTLQVEALVNAFAGAANITRPESRRIVEFFTFRGEPGQEIWAQPLVPVGPDTVAPVFAAAVSPNLRRLVDVWMRRAGIDLGKRGPAFEAHLRELVVTAIKGSKLLSHVATCITDDYIFRPPDDRDEQIDLVFSIGDTVFVAETKCVLEPSDAKGIAMHHKAVIAAAEQVLRKAKALEDHRTAFIIDVKRFGMHLTNGFKVVPLVVVSTSTHVGIPAKEVPVIDEHILGRFLDGELEDIAYQPQTPSSSKRSKTLFYSNAIEAEVYAPTYFASPPQIQRFIDGVRERVVPIFAISENDWEGRFVTLECVAGGGPLSIQGRPSSNIGNNVKHPDR